MARNRLQLRLNDSQWERLLLIAERSSPPISPSDWLKAAIMGGKPINSSQTARPDGIRGSGIHAGQLSYPRHRADSES